MQTKTEPRSCHWSQHLGGCQYVVYSVLTRILISRGMSEITISSRHLAAMTVYGRNAIMTALRELEAAGWIKRFAAEVTGGRYKPDTYTLDSHDEWAAKHPGRCPPGPKIVPGSKSGLIRVNRS